jgi:hypothetical protein
MRLFDKKAEKKLGIVLIASIPVVLFALLKQKGELGKTEIVITIITFLVGVGIVYFLKWYSNKK